MWGREAATYNRWQGGREEEREGASSICRKEEEKVYSKMPKKNKTFFFKINVKPPAPYFWDPLKKNLDKKKWESVLRSASVERFSVSRMRDFLNENHRIDDTNA